MTTPLKKTYLTTVEAAEYLRLQAWSVRKAVSRGTLVPSRHKIGNSNLFTVRELDRYKKHHSRKQ